MRIQQPAVKTAPSALKTHVDNPSQTPLPRAQDAFQASRSRSAFEAKSAPPTPDVQSTMKREFGSLASDKTKFHDTMKKVFGESYDTTKAEGFRKKALGGDFSWLPPVKWVGADVLGGANGAYDSENKTVYLNRALMGDPAKAASTYVEEAGHFLDTQLNTQDTVGDEGELFRRVLSGEKLSQARIAEIRADDDHGTITVDGKKVEVEFWDPFKDIGKALSDAAKWVGDTVTTAANAVGNAVTTAANAVGNAVTDAAKWVGNTVSGAANAVGGFFKEAGARIGDAAGSIFSGIRDSVSGVVQNIGEGLSNIGSGVADIFRGNFGEGFKRVGLGLLKTVVQTPVDAIMMGAGKTLSAVQTLVGVEPKGRGLTPQEKTLLQSVYGNTIDYDHIKIKQGDAGLLTVGKRAFVLGDTIYVPANTVFNENDLVHETGHIWQHQHGGTDYMSESLGEQYVWGTGNANDAYDFYKALDAGKPWSEMNPEQQATLIEHAYINGFFSPNPAKAATATLKNGSTDYTAQVKQAIAEMRAGRGAP